MTFFSRCSEKLKHYSFDLIEENKNKYSFQQDANDALGFKTITVKGGGGDLLFGEFFFFIINLFKAMSR